MNEDVAWVGMRVGYNAIARKRKGIITVKWDNGETFSLSPWWLRQVEWARGGYTHGKRKLTAEQS